MAQCNFGTCEWFCVLTEGHAGDHSSEPIRPQASATGLVPVYVREWFTAPQPPIDVNPDVQHIVAKVYLAADVEAWLERERDGWGDYACVIDVLLAQLRGGWA